MSDVREHTLHLSTEGLARAEALLFTLQVSYATEDHVIVFTGSEQLLQDVCTIAGAGPGQEVRVISEDDAFPEGALPVVLPLPPPVQQPSQEPAYSLGFDRPALGAQEEPQVVRLTAADLGFVSAVIEPEPVASEQPVYVAPPAPPAPSPAKPAVVRYATARVRTLEHGTPLVHETITLSLPLQAATAERIFREKNRAFTTKDRVFNVDITVDGSVVDCFPPPKT